MAETYRMLGYLYYNKFTYLYVLLLFLFLTIIKFYLPIKFLSIKMLTYVKLTVSTVLPSFCLLTPVDRVIDG